MFGSFLKFLAITAALISEVSTNTDDPTGAVQNELTQQVASLKTELQGLRERIQQLESRASCEAMAQTQQQQVQQLSNQLQTCVANYSQNAFDYGQCQNEKASLINQLTVLHIQIKGATLDLSKCATKGDVCKEDNAACGSNLGQCETLKSKLQTDLTVCQTATLNFPKTCGEWKRLGYTTNGYYVIDPDGAGSAHQFQVECDMTIGQDGRTIIHHDSESRIQVRPRCGGPRCYSRKIKYVLTMAQVKSLMNISKHCIQYIKYDCLYTFHQSGNHAAWLSYDGQAQTYWGGAAPGSKKCACGMTNSCDKPGLPCNCDANDGVWRSDAGMLDDKSTLPVTGVMFGDMDGNEEDAYHRVGPLQCFGK